MTQQPNRIVLGALTLEPGSTGMLWTMSHGHAPERRYVVTGPAFEIDSVERGDFHYTGHLDTRPLKHGGQELTLRYIADGAPLLMLDVMLRGYPGSPITRLRYRLTSETDAALTKREGQDAIRYLTVASPSAQWSELTEIQLSHFDPVAHTYMPAIETHPTVELYDGLSFAGPIALLHDAEHTCLAAYEHGADHPLAFIRWTVGRGEDAPLLHAEAAKGNYYRGQPVGPARPWESVWFELGLAPVRLDEFLRCYRRFFLEEISESAESRRPYLFYNTWNYQERNRYFRNRPYLESMHFERIAAEIDVAHRLGIDVFVVDTGWYSKTGDWLVNMERFPDALQEIRRKLDGYGMKLGLWFNPTVAALTSDIFRTHPEYEMTRDSSPRWRGPVWETEESANMCLASGYTDYFIEQMVRLHHELGVVYFKWDAISQYGRDSPNHHHGTRENAPQERADCYAYTMGRQMIRIVEEVSQRCPNVIVDFDITEGGRFVGLGFLSAGKYFLINNGPYFSDFDIPHDVRIDPDMINVFFYPGAARSRICRQGVKYDPVIPSILFLTHYLPDAPRTSQRNSLAALVLGGNGIWGDLLDLNEEDVDSLGEQLAHYKRVADPATRAYPRMRGFLGSSPEIHEKIDPETSSGLVAFFTVAPGTITHVTQPLGAGSAPSVVGADTVERLLDGRLKLTVNLERDDARVVFIGGS